MKTSTLMFVVAVALSGCGPQSLVTDGTYQSDGTGPLPNASLVIDLKAKTASVTLSGTSTAVALQLTAVPAASWEKGCPTNVSSVAVETFTVAPDPAVLGSLSLAGPKLLAGCGLDKGDPDTVILEGTGAPNATRYQLHFQRVVR
ncbi:MAG: hypothetical protein Q8L48_26780 [Archangium sp.]|nr:hypothetical protein [Archangium sp.]